MQLDEIMAGYDSQTDDIEKRTWDEAVEHFASCVYFDGIPFNVLYPNCIEKIKASYNPDAIESGTYLQNEDIDELDFCMIGSGVPAP